MRVFAINYSEDGMSNMAATNVKSLFSIIEGSGYKPLTIFYNGNEGKGVEQKYSYNSLLKAMNREGYFGWGYITCEGGSVITVTELQLISK